MSINDRVGDAMSRLFASMTMFWACVALDVLALPGLVLTVASALGVKVPSWAVALSVLVIVVSFMSQTVIQLLALPVLARQNDKQQAAGDKRTELLVKLVEELCEHDGVCVPDECEGTDE